MLEAVFLGVRGVLLPLPAFENAEIEAAAASLSAQGVPAEAFRAAARRRLARAGPRALISLSLQDLGIHVAPDRIRAARLRCRQAAPRTSGKSPFRAALRDLRRRYTVGFLDAGNPEVLDTVVARLRLQDVSDRRLWTESLGHLARPPRRLAFRWLADRLGIRPSTCLYVAGSDLAWRGARRAGWRVWPPSTPPSGEGIDPWELLEGIDRLEGMD